MSGEQEHRESIVALAERKGLDTSLLYESVMDLALEGMLTARCVNAAARILLNDLGLPRYYFRTIAGPALRTVLQVIAKNLNWEGDGGHCVLNERVAYLEASGEDDIQVLMSCESNRASMEEVAGARMMKRRWEYYFAPHTRYYSYMIKPESCPTPEEAASIDCAYAFSCARDSQGFSVPQETGDRYRDFLARQQATVSRLVEFSASRGTGETRIMFHKNIAYYYLPVIRCMLDARGLQLNRAYGEPYRTQAGTVASVCSFYVKGALDAATQHAVAADLRAFLALGECPFAHRFLDGALSFTEMVFATNLAFFVHHFIFRDLESDRQIMDSIRSRELREALAKRINDANRSEYTRRLITETLVKHPDRVKQLFGMFEMRFNPSHADSFDSEELDRRLERFERSVAIEFVNDVTALEIMRFATRLITQTLKTNFYVSDKRSFAYRLDSNVLDPVVFTGDIYGIYFVMGHYSLGTHMRAADIARGGLRLLRVTEANYENQLDDANLLNYALGPKAQRLKHKDIAESGAKGVIVPTLSHAHNALQAIYDFTDGIMDLMLPNDHVVDYLESTEMLFFGPDEGTAPLMDAVAARARERGYPYWRTMTTGKAIGVPHDAYGLRTDDRVFGLIEREDEGTEVLLDGARVILSDDPDAIVEAMGSDIATSGMTTTSVMAAFRTVIAHCGMREADLNLLMTGGPDGDLGANQIQCYKGRICMIVDGGGVLVDPHGIDRDVLLRLAVSRHRRPRPNSADFPESALGPGGFLVRRGDRDVTLPDGTTIEDGAFFHRNVLVDPATRDLVQAAGIEAFVPCGGFKDTINFTNVRTFLENFPELKVIVEGANVFFDDTARDVIAAESEILQIKDSTANKGGVTCSSLSEILTAFLLEDDYEACLVENADNKCRLVRELLEVIRRNAERETTMLLSLRETSPETPLYRLSIETSEELLDFQQELYGIIEKILAHDELVRRVILEYTPPILVDLLGADAILARLDAAPLQGYRNAIVTKKLAAMALYSHAPEWEAFVERFHGDSMGVLNQLL